ncbi:hypothetical protein ACG7TL_000132 [Trametes sanguinea]
MGPRSVLTPPAVAALHAVLALQTSYLRVFISISGFLLPPHVTPAAAAPPSISDVFLSQRVLCPTLKSGMCLAFKKGTSASEALEEWTLPQLGIGKWLAIADRTWPELSFRVLFNLNGLPPPDASIPRLQL